MTTEKTLELRMYFFVPYNISPIQQAIQAGHAALEYAHLNGGTPLFIDFVRNWKTWIILNGGTTNNKLSEVVENEYAGTLNQIRADIIKFNYDHRNDDDLDPIEYADFYEPDLNDAMTAVCFICDERVFNYDNYLPFLGWFRSIPLDPNTKAFMDRMNINPKAPDEEYESVFPEYFAKWVEHLGGEKNYFLRTLLKGKKLA